MSYAGWKNYETWAIYNWLHVPEHCAKWQEITRQCIKRNSDKSEDAINELAKQMCESILEGVQVNSNIASNAIKQVDWHSIAKSFIEDILV